MSKDVAIRISEIFQEVEKLKVDSTEMRELLSAQISKIEAERQEIAKQVTAYGYEVASRRGYEKTIGVILAVIAAVGIGIGAAITWFGFDTFDKVTENTDAVVSQTQAAADTLNQDVKAFKATLKDQINDAIAMHFNRQEQQKRIYEANAEAMSALIDDLQAAKLEWIEIQPAIEGLGNYDSNADLKGDYLSLLENQKNVLSEEELSSEDRARYVGIVLRVTKHLKQAEADTDFQLQFTPSDVFNVAQMARSLRRPDLERQLVDAALRLDNEPSTRALHLQLQAVYGPLGKREAEFSKLLELVAELTMDSPHIVIAEAWNAAEGLRRYNDFLKVLDDRIAAHKKNPTLVLPSSAYSAKGTAHLRRGHPGDLPVAMKSYIEAIRLLAEEGTYTQWWEASISGILNGAKELYFSGQDITAINNAVNESGVVPLKASFGELYGAVSGALDASQPLPQELLDLLRQVEEQETSPEN